jgi:hypothetical protein
MNINYTEQDTMNPYETFDYNSYETNADNYWEKPTTNQQPKKKKVSFNDILSNMNLVVDKNGVLKAMIAKQPEELFYGIQEQQQPAYNKQIPLIKKQQHVYNEQPKNNEPLDASVKHSYIYNKYFKDYTDANVKQDGPRVPKTMEEYRQMLLEDRIKAIQHAKMIEQVKSKKMMFTSAPGAVHPRNIKPTFNNLRSMNFR